MTLNNSVFNHTIRRIKSALIACLIMAMTLTALPFSGGALDAQNVGKPNIIVINLDDADFKMLSPENLAIFFPNMQKFSTDGIRFTNYHVTTPLCGPSRACLFRGQYAHSTGIRANDPYSFRSNGFDGGMKLYQEKGYFQNDLSTWMQDAGYRTMMVGKFLHGDVLNIVPQGWDDFYSSRGANYYETWRFKNDASTEGSSTQEAATTYRTNQESSEIVSLVDQHQARDDGKPFFLYIAPLAPHQQTPHSPYGMIDTQYDSWWQSMRMERNDSVQEADFSDKSTAIRDVPPMTANNFAKIDQRHRDRMLTVKSVDVMFGQLMDRLQQHQIDDNTYIFLTSDNGFSNGHHRMIGKGDGFDRSTHVPMYVLGPGVAAGATANHLLAHIDLAPTVVELAGGTVPDFVDGKSFAPLISNPDDYVSQAWRNALLIENFESRYLNDANYNTASNALRFYDSIYVEWADGSPEYYDLTEDPLQIDNSIEDLPVPERNFLSSYLKTFRQTPVDPDTTIYEPFELNALVSRKHAIKGMAVDDSGVTRVRLAIKRFSDSFFWNGDKWQPERILVDADVTQPGQMMSTWTYSSLPKGQAADEMIGIWARAYDDAGKWDRSVAFSIFRIDYTRPQTTITTPVKNDTIDSFEVFGTAEDEGGVDFVRLVVRDRTTGRYFDGAEWRDDWVWIPVPVALSGRWRYSHDELAGSIYVSSRAVDLSGNVQSPPTAVWFSVIK